MAAAAAGCRADILDVGCGDGTLEAYLAGQGRRITAIDPSAACIARCRQAYPDLPDVHFVQASFETLPAASYDAVIFVASLHHMELASAVRKAKALLRDGGVLLVVGIADPTSLSDHLLEALRVIPSAISSRLHRMKTVEALDVPTSYAFPDMEEMRALLDTDLPGASLRRGLHYRYLLRWEKSPAFAQDMTSAVEI